MRARSLIWRSLPRAGRARHCTSLATTPEGGVADGLLSEAAAAAALQLAADHPQSPLAQATLAALRPEDEPVPMMPLYQLEDIEGLYQSLTQPLAPQHRTRSDRHEKLRQVNTSPEAFWSQTTPSVQSFDHLIRACGMQGKLARARAYFDEMEFVGLSPEESTYSALISAHARGGDVRGARAVLDECVAHAGLEPNAPMLTGLVGAIRRAGRPAEEAHAVLGLSRRLGVTEDTPLHTAIVQAYIDQKQPDAAWKAFNEMRYVGVEADAVTYSCMLTACAMQARCATRVHCPPLTTHHSPLTTHHAPTHQLTKPPPTTHHPQPTTHNPPRTTYHAPRTAPLLPCSTAPLLPCSPAPLRTGPARAGARTARGHGHGRRAARPVRAQRLPQRLRRAVQDAGRALAQPAAAAARPRR